MILAFLLLTSQDGELARLEFFEKKVRPLLVERCYKCHSSGGESVKGGLVHGATDDYGVQVTEKPVHVHDFHATILHLLGLDHERLTFRHLGRDFRLTDVAGKVVREILA